jgi:GNAT superfamily N-acetyltransferase
MLSFMKYFFKCSLLALLISGSAFAAVIYREASEKDVPDLVGMVKELAAFESKKPEEVLLTPEKFLKHAFGKDHYFQVLVAEKDQKLIGYALYFFSYSGYKGAPVLYIEDLYVSEPHRKQGIGTAMLSRLKKISEEKECCRMEWHVFDWNEPAIKFYQSLGGVLRKDLIQVRLEN